MSTFLKKIFVDFLKSTLLRAQNKMLLSKRTKKIFCGLLRKPKLYRECVRAGAAGAQTHRSLGHPLLHPLILRLLVVCAPAVLRTRALQDAPAPADPNS